MKLKVSDFSTPGFDRQPPVLRKTHARPRVEIIEGATFNDNYELRGYTYTPSTGHLRVVTSQNKEVFSKKIKTRADFDRAINRKEATQ